MPDQTPDEILTTTGNKLNVLLIGGGGREHALARAISRSERLDTLFTTDPSNPGLASLARAVDVPVSAREIYRLQQFCDKNRVGLVVIGPEDPLSQGFADKLAAPGRAVFGPRQNAAMIESDKAWSKQLMRSASIPTAEGRVFSDFEHARTYVSTREEPPVIKAAGLAKGKGVIVPATIQEALEALERIMRRREFGDAGRQVVVEERLEGREVSVLALVDGHSILVLPPCQDHKRLRDRDEGPNTGGMGAFCPSGSIDDATMAQIESEILVPTVDALRREDIEYRGVLYAGLMLTPAGPKVLEFNARFGDPECQCLMARLESDAIELLLATCQGRLADVDVRWSADQAVCVVLAAPGYPDTPKKNVVITGLDAAAKQPHAHVLHAGTARNAEGAIVTAGGRVLNVVATGPDLKAAASRAYAAADLIKFDGKQMRRDIGVAL
ncbi:MAG: phosphoribosylamine--glycine ligase [Planctomycetota bacterium]|nr:phosphoribosylamine--glycine ligase [Planctomycetota bacterium]